VLVAYVTGNRPHGSGTGTIEATSSLRTLEAHEVASEVATTKRDARLAELMVAGWTTEWFVEFWSAPDLKWVPPIITDDVVGYWPGGRTVRGKAEYVQALAELLAVVPNVRLEVQEHAMSHDGQFGFSRWVMHATGSNGPFELVGMDRTRVRDGRVCENYVFFDPTEFRQRVGT
jgi:ketosteroid isomerase-like protein